MLKNFKVKQTYKFSKSTMDLGTWGARHWGLLVSRVKAQESEGSKKKHGQERMKKQIRKKTYVP